MVLGIFGLRFFVGAVLAAAPGGHLVRCIAGGLVWELAVIFVYLFNGVTDVRADRANGSARPIARGALEPETALLVACGAALVALLGALLIGGVVIALVAMLLTLGYLYSGPPWYLKRHSGATAAIGVAGGLLSYLAGPASLGTLTVSPGPWMIFAACASLWMGLVGTLAKDLPHIAGDIADGRLSLAARLGEQLTQRILAAAGLSIAGCFTLAALIMSKPLIVPATAMLFGAITLALLAHSHAARPGGKGLREPYRVFMRTQYRIHVCIFVTLVFSALFT